jgi:dTDP-4-amino-4,6-dideoxygalactose transaminase
MSRFKAKPINYGRHSISRADIRAVRRALKSDWLTIGPEVNLFEKELEAYLGCETIAVSSGTAALHCAYQAIGILPGDEIIAPSITFMATHATAMLSGAKIVFADVDPKSGLIDPESVRNLITDRTRAIVVVDFAGIPADIDKIKSICRAHNLYLIQDAAHSIGSKYKGNMVGTLADITVFSFFPTKNMTTCEGGALSSKDPALLSKARLFARQGTIRDKASFSSVPHGDWYHEFHSFGLNYRLPDVLCALGRSQLARLDKFIARRREIANYYFESLDGISTIELPAVASWVEPAWHFFPILVPSHNRPIIYEQLHKRGIRVQVNYIPVNAQPVFSMIGYSNQTCPGAHEFYSREISLPIHPGLKLGHLKRITKALRRIMADIRN